MNVPETYDYLVRARRDLWSTLVSVPDELLSRPLLNGSRLHCIKDLVAHVPTVEHFWLHEDILHQQPVRETIPALKGADWGPIYGSFALRTLLDYWHVVEESTLAYLGALTDDELKRMVIVHDAPEERYTVDGLLWHVMIHEMRHAAQMAVLLPTQGIEPPWLDLKNYLPLEPDQCTRIQREAHAASANASFKTAAQGKFVTFGVTRGFIAVASPVSSMTWLIAP